VQAGRRITCIIEHYHVEVGGVPVHFLRNPGTGPRPVPLILTHEWPWTFWHWSEVIDQLVPLQATFACGR
jgi:epoxide hydrolase-like protein